MKMVRSDRAASGVVFTLDTESGFRDVVFVTGAYGLGENVVQGAVDPDEFYIHKPTFQDGYRAVLSRRLGRKQKRMIYGRGKSATTRSVVTWWRERGAINVMSGSAARPLPITPRLRGSSQGSASTPSASIRRASCAPSLSWPRRKRAALALARNWRPPHENARRR
jgi:Pyruvate phosphate dikinase, AMP/ATP-binding domain